MEIIVVSKCFFVVNAKTSPQTVADRGFFATSLGICFRNIYGDFALPCFELGKRSFFKKEVF